MKIKPNSALFKKSDKRLVLVAFTALIGLIFVGLSSCVSKSRLRPEDLRNVRTLAGFSREFGEPFGLAIKNDIVYVSDGQNGKILTVSKHGTVSIFAEGLDTPSGIAFDKNGQLFIADSGSNAIRKIDAAGTLSTVAGADAQAGYADGEATAARFNGPIGIAVSDDGTIYVTDTYNDRIRVVRDGTVTTLAGSGRGFSDGPGSLAKFDTPCGLALMPDGDLLVADFGNRRLRLVSHNGDTSTLVGTGRGESRDGLLGAADISSPVAVSVDPNGSIFITDGNALRVIRMGAFPFVQTIAGRRRGLQDGNKRSSEFNRPSGIAVDSKGDVFVADSDNQLVRVLSDHETGKTISLEEIAKLQLSADEFRTAAPPRWPYEPPDKKREIAGTLGEIRGEIGPKNDPVWFHNGLDVVGSYGETARFVRDEKVLLPLAVQNFGTLREQIRMPTMGYIHIRIGRDQNERPLGDKRFQFDGVAKLTDVRVPRGTKFRASEPIGTLNPMNHVHLIAGPSGDEMNSLDALILPGISDSIPPTIEKVSLFDESWREIETAFPNSRIKLTGKTRVVVRAYDRMDSNADRRRLGVFSVGYTISSTNGNVITDHRSAINFKRMPDDRSVMFAYAPGSKSGATGETIFNYIATNEVGSDFYREGFLDPADYQAGQYILKVYLSDYFGNTVTKDISFEVIK